MSADMTTRRDRPEAAEDAALRPRRFGVRSVVIVAVLVALAVAGVVGYGYVSRQRDATTRLAAVTDTVEQADVLVAKIDQVVTSPVAEGTEGRADEALALVDQAAEQLEGASAELAALTADLRDAERARAAALADAVRARLDMLEQVPAILAVSAKAARALPDARTGWESAVRADGLSERAVREYNKLTKAGVDASARLNRQAGAVLTTARQDLLSSENAFPEAGLEVYIAYIDARIALNRLSRRSDSAWLAGDIEEANRIIKSYNAEDKKVVAMARTLPSSPASVIAVAFENSTEDAFAAYYSARQAATRADERAGGS